MNKLIWSIEDIYFPYFEWKHSIGFKSSVLDYFILEFSSQSVSRESRDRLETAQKSQVC